MAKKLTSAGVTFSETDSSFVAPQTLGRPEAVIGLAQRGPAFNPTICQTWDEYTSRFNERNIYMHGPYGAYYTLKKSSPLTYVRVLGIDTTSTDATARHAGFTVLSASAIVFSSSNAGATNNVNGVACIIHSNGSVKETVHASGTNPRNFTLSIAGYNNSQPLSVSLYRGDKNYIGRVLNSDPAAYNDTSTCLDGITSKKHYIFRNFCEVNESCSLAATSITSSRVVSGTDYTAAYTHAKTPWVESQNFNSVAAPQRYSLFRCHTLGDGDYENTNCKVSIENIRNSVNTSSTEYGTFDLVVRDFDDIDKTQTIYEKFTDLTLDLNSKNYVGARIGTIQKSWDSTTSRILETGDYPSKSAYIWVEESADLKNGLVPTTAVPWGFDNTIPMLSSSAFSGSMNFSVAGAAVTASVPNLPYVLDQTWKGEYNSKIHWGFTQASTGSGTSYYLADELRYIPTAASVTYQPRFSLDYLTSSVGTSGSFGSGSFSGIVFYNTGSANLSQSSIAGTTLAQFTVPFFGGFDGLNIHYKNPIANEKIANFTTTLWTTATDAAKSYEITSIRNAVDTLSNPDTQDFKDLAIPGVFHPGALGYAIDMVEDRTDAFLICDISGSTVANAKSWRENNFTYDTSYAACYWPKVKVYDNYNSKYVWLYPTSLMLGVLGYNDVVSFPWFAPAGFNRGDITSDAKSLEIETKVEERNDLYDRQINPLAKLEGSIVVWGQKTLQLKASALDRINVRRLLNHIKKAFAGYSKFLLFENINASLFDKFKSMANPFLARIIQNNGLNGYQLIMDESNNTPESRANNEINCKLILEPTLTGERMSFNFTITRQGTFGA